MKKSFWFLVCEWDFAVLGSVMAWGGAPVFVSLWMVFMCIWMMKKTFKESKKENSQ